MIKHVVMVVPDSLRWDYWVKHRPTPRGSEFNSSTSGLWTPTSMVSVLTGLFPNNTHVHDFKDGLRRDIPNILSMMNMNGYKCRFSELQINQNLHIGIHTKGLTFPILFNRSGFKFHEAKQLTQIIDEDEPSFTWIHCMHTHVPYNQGRWLLPQYMRDLILAEELEHDELCGYYDESAVIWSRVWDNFLNWLDELKRNDILVIMLSDHGEMLLENYGSIKRYWHNYDYFSEMIHVPVVWYQPGRTANFRQRQNRQRHVDIFPELMKRMGWTIPSMTNGVPYDSTIRYNLVYAAQDKGIGISKGQNIFAEFDTRKKLELREKTGIYHGPKDKKGDMGRAIERFEDEPYWNGETEGEKK